MVNSDEKIIQFVFFGTDEFSVEVLETLKGKSFLPTLIITMPDKPKGRKLILNPPPVKIWAEKNKIHYLQPDVLNVNFASVLKSYDIKIALVASYGNLIPKYVLETMEYGFLNIHPSLLPDLRGPSPLQETILQNKKPAVTIIKMDEKMDHGPIIGQRNLTFLTTNAQAQKDNINILTFEQIRKTLAKEGADLFIEILPKWINKKIKAQPQNESLATYTKLIEKKDGLIDLKDNPEKNYRKFLAYYEWPGTYFFEKNKRIKITDATLESEKFIIKKVIPENGKEKFFTP